MLCGSAKSTLEKNVENGISFHLIEPSLCFLKEKEKYNVNATLSLFLRSCVRLRDIPAYTLVEQFAMLNNAFVFSTTQKSLSFSRLKTLTSSSLK